MTERSQEDRERLDTKWAETHRDSRDHRATLEEKATIGSVHARIIVRETRYHELAVVEAEVVAPNGMVFNFGAPRYFRGNLQNSPLWKALPYAKKMEKVVVDYFKSFYLEHRAA